MKAIIMAGGEGRRLKTVTGGLPKPMVPFLGRPLMERIVDLLREAGIADICAALKFNPQPIIDYFGDGSRFGVSMQYRIEEEALGTAGGVKNCADFYMEEDFLVISGDAACDFDLSELIEKHLDFAPAVTMALFESPDPLQYGLVLQSPDGYVRHFIEKPNWERVVTNLVNTGIYVVSPRAMELVPQGQPFDFARDLFPLLLEREERILGAVAHGYWCDIGTPRAYFSCCLDALDGKLRLSGLPEDAALQREAEALEPLAGSEVTVMRIACPDRARLMRSMSECMMEAGADFTDGLSIKAPHCGVRVSPVADESAIEISAAANDADFAKELALSMEELAKSLAE